MDNLHDKLMEKNGSYAKWHRHPKSGLLQWLFLVTVVVVIAALLVTRINNQNPSSYGQFSSASAPILTGTHWPTAADFPTLKNSLGMDFAIVTVNPSDTAGLQQYLAAAKTSGMQLIIGAYPAPYTLNSDGATWTGQQVGAMGTADITDGTVDGNTISWKMSITVPMPMTLDCTATIDGDTLTGSVGAGAFGSFPMSGTRTA